MGSIAHNTDVDLYSNTGLAVSLDHSLEEVTAALALAMPSGGILHRNLTMHWISNHPWRDLQLCDLCEPTCCPGSASWKLPCQHEESAAMWSSDSHEVEAFSSDQTTSSGIFHEPPNSGGPQMRMLCLRLSALKVSISQVVVQSDISDFSFTTNLSASISNCLAFFDMDTSHSRDVQRSGAKYLSWRESCCWAHMSWRACDGSIWRSINTSFNLNHSGISFYLWDFSTLCTSSFNWLITNVCPSNSKRFSTARSPNGAMAPNTSCENVSNSPATIGTPGCPWENASFPRVVIPPAISALMPLSDIIISSALLRKCASESTSHVILAQSFRLDDLWAAGFIHDVISSNLRRNKPPYLAKTKTGRIYTHIYIYDARAHHPQSLRERHKHKT